MQNILQSEAFPRIQPRSNTSGKKRFDRPAIRQAMKAKAIAQDIELTEDRKEVIEFVMDFYEHCEDCRNARQLMTVMAQEFEQQGGKKYLYRLFPKGPLTQIHDLTDLPDLRYQVDNGFGTSY